MAVGVTNSFEVLKPQDAKPKNSALFVKLALIVEWLEGSAYPPFGGFQAI
jgi:hypothetical protein